MKKSQKRKPTKPSAGERLTAVENSIATAMATFQEFKQMLGTQAVKDLASKVEKLESLFKPEMAALLGELRAVRYLLDTKKQYAHMDRPRPELGVPPFAEGPVGPSLAEGPRP